MRQTMRAGWRAVLLGLLALGGLVAGRAEAAALGATQLTVGARLRRLVVSGAGQGLTRRFPQDSVVLSESPDSPDSHPVYLARRAINSTATPYNATFAVTSVTYSKVTSGLVTANIAYELTMTYPFYGKLNGTSASNYLIHSGTLYAGLDLDGTWSHTASRTGLVQADGSACAADGDTCMLAGVLSYAWTPSTSTTCSLSSSTAYQFDFVLGCNATSISDECGNPLRDAVVKPKFGQFELVGNIDFCRVAATDFPISWPTPFDHAGDSTRTLGGAITTSGILEAKKKIVGIALKEYRVFRSDLTGSWSLWSPGSTSVAYGATGYDGSSTAIGLNTGFVFSDPVSSNGGMRWTISASFTPNIKIYTTAKNFVSTTAQGNYLIILPDDAGKLISFTTTIDLRLYTDSQAFSRRRLLYRDAQVSLAEPAGVQDASVSTSPITLTVPSSVQVSNGSEGDQTPVVKSSAGLSAGAVAGIATVGVLAGLAGIGLVGFAVWRHKRNLRQREAAHAGMEAKIVGSYAGPQVDFPDLDKARMTLLSVPATAYVARKSGTLILQP